MVFTLLIACIYQSPAWLRDVFEMSLVMEAVFTHAILTFIAGCLITYHLPRFSVRLVNYPVISPEPMITDETSFDSEKGSDAKRL